MKRRVVTTVSTPSTLFIKRAVSLCTPTCLHQAMRYDPSYTLSHCRRDVFLGRALRRSEAMNLVRKDRCAAVEQLDIMDPVAFLASPFAVATYGLKRGGPFMIITVRNNARSEERAQLTTFLCRVIGSQRPAISTTREGREVIVLDGSQLDAQACSAISDQTAVECVVQVNTPYKLVSRAFKADRSCILVGDAGSSQPFIIGGHAATPVVMAGPCAVESRAQLLATAQAVKAAGAQILRGGAFKPRTSPYQFQGLGVEGLKMLAEAREETGLPVITEVMEPDMVETVANYADILQIGSRNMQNFPLLFAAGRNSQHRPVMLKRGLAATIDEWLLAAEYIVAAGNPNVILCERGIRSFDTHTRNLLDLTCVPLLHELTHLPVIVDPSHATGRRELVPPMSRAGIAAGADGLILEVHPDPNSALCDGRQSITPEQLQSIVRETQLLSQMLVHGTWYQQLSDLSDKSRQKCSRRPDPVQLSSVPSTFQKVIRSGDASQDEVGWDVTRRSQR